MEVLELAGTPAVKLVLYVFMVYRVSLMVSSEEGPGLPWGSGERRKWGMFARIREHLDPERRTWLGRGVSCPYCVSFWIALLLAPLLTAPTVIVIWLGIAGIVRFLMGLGAR